MASPHSPDRERDDDSSLRTRVERLEHALAEQKQVLDELRAEVERLRAGDADVTHGASHEARKEAEGPSTVATDAPGQEDAINGGGQPEEQVASHPPEDEAAPETTASGTSAPGRSTAPPRASESPSPQSPNTANRVLDRLVSWVSLRSEDWLNYVGIGLLLFGLAFLFKYSVEQGWLVPEVRVGFGTALGGMLLAAGLRIYDTRRRLRQVLLGGSSATFYATVFAAYQLYGLISYPVAFAGMAVVTVVTIGLAVRQEESSLAIIGTIGGLGTPFLLYSQAGSVGGFTAYTCTVLTGACVIFLVRGWRSLLYTTVAGGWIVFLVAAARAGVIGSRPPDIWALQVGIGVAWGVLAGTPVARAVFRRTHPDGWPGASRPGWVDRLLGGNRPMYGLITASPFLALGASRLLWDPADDAVWAVVAGVGAVVYAGAHLGLRRVSLAHYAPMHGLVAAVLAAYGLSEVLGGSALLVAWAVEVVLLLGLARRLDARALRVAGHGLFVVLTIGLANRLADVTPSAVPIVRPAVLSEMVVLGLTAGASALVRRRGLRWTYRGIVLAGWLGWWAGELVPLPNGNAYLLVVWALTATGLAAMTPRLDDRRPARVVTHLLFVLLTVLLVAHFRGADAATLRVVSIPALSTLLVLGLALVASRYVSSDVRTLYRGVVLAGWLWWWVHELAPLAYGQAYVSAVWGGTAAALLVGGAWRDHRSVQIGGLATLGLFVGKLFFVDLASLPALWRIALFLGFGSVFLAISYLLPGLMVGSSDHMARGSEDTSASVSEEG